MNFVTGQTTPQSIQVIWNQPTGTVVPKYEVVLTDTNGGVVTTGVVSQDEIVNGAFDFIFHAPQPDTNYISRLYALMDDGTRVELAMIRPSSGREFFFFYYWELLLVRGALGFILGGARKDSLSFSLSHFELISFLIVSLFGVFLYEITFRIKDWIISCFL